MSPAASAESDEDQRDRCASKLIFFLLVLGVTMLCIGLLISIFGYHACVYATQTHCSTVMKVTAPTCAAVGFGALILAWSRTRLQRRERRRRGILVDPDGDFMCGESRQFAQCLVFGFLFFTSGMLISILSVWAPGCHSHWEQENETDTEDSYPPVCMLLSLHILGPLAVLLGLCFFVVAHIKKRSSLNARQEAHENEERQTQNTETVQVTVGDAVIIFPPPPPPYFPESSSSAGTQSCGPSSLLQNEEPPSYYSIYNGRTSASEGPGAVSGRNQVSIYTISGTPSFSDSSHTPHPSADLPPPYEEKETTGATSSSPPSEPAPP